MIARLNKQTLRIVERLKEGPATNRDLSSIALKYTSRISDARSMGYTITCAHLGGGLTQYTLSGVV